MVNFKALMINAVLAALFIIALINFGVILAGDNNANMSVLNDSGLLDISDNLNETIIDAQSTGVTDWEALEGDNINPISDIAILSIPKIAVSLPRIGWDLYLSMLNLLSSTIGLPVIFIYSINVILVVVIIVGIISLIKAGR